MNAPERNDADRLSELRGLIQGVLADDEVNLREFAKLDIWLAENPSIADTWPANAIQERLRQISADDIVDPAELEALKFLLQDALQTDGS